MTNTIAHLVSNLLIRGIEMPELMEYLTQENSEAVEEGYMSANLFWYNYEEVDMAPVPGSVYTEDGYAIYTGYPAVDNEEPDEEDLRLDLDEDDEALKYDDSPIDYDDGLPF